MSVGRPVNLTLRPGCLQSHGERLSDGWTPVFRLLAAVPASGEGDAIDLAFQSVQLTCSDYMAPMPFARLKRCLEVALLYGSQQADVNVSLTTISLLWNAADLFGKAPAGGARPGSARPVSAGSRAIAAAADDDESDTEVEAAVGGLPPAVGEEEEESEEEVAATPSGKRSQLAASLSPAQTEELLQMIFLALQLRTAGAQGRTPSRLGRVPARILEASQQPSHGRLPQIQFLNRLPAPPPPPAPCTSPAGCQPGCAARGAQQRRAHPVCRGGQPGAPPVTRPLGAVPLGDALPAAAPRLPHVRHRQQG